MDTLHQSLFISAAGMHAQGKRMRTVTQNIANRETTSSVPGGDPYRRQTIHFRNVFDRELGTEKVTVHAIREDQAPFPLRYDPYHPGANEQGYVKMPNLKSLIEINDFRQSNRSYETMVNSYRLTRQMITKTVEMLR